MERRNCYKVANSNKQNEGETIITKKNYREEKRLSLCERLKTLSLMRSHDVFKIVSSSPLCLKKITSTYIS